jgi:formamidopyrimidine-DNA glycosylase
MPELAEVEYFRKQWNVGLARKIITVNAPDNRVLRGVDLPLLRKTLTGATLLDSAAHGKQMLFRFSQNAWLGVHLGMTGKLHVTKNDAPTGKHDRLVLRQKENALVFTDPRQFGRILFDVTLEAPAWWQRLPPQILSLNFTLERMGAFLKRHGRAPIKAVLLLQAGFPGVGNWMADEILWQARVHPRKSAGTLTQTELRNVFSRTRSISRLSMRVIGTNWGDPPKNWLFHRRWRRGGVCPRDKSPLRHATIGGRTTCWCPACQKKVNRAP